MQARVGDGLEAVAQRASQQEAGLDILIVDASGGDPSQAMTCPPAAFLERQFLQDAHRSLAQEGLLVMNCVCRSQPVFDSAVAALQVNAAFTQSTLPCSCTARRLQGYSPTERIVRGCDTNQAGLSRVDSHWF